MWSGCVSYYIIHLLCDTINIDLFLKAWSLRIKIFVWIDSESLCLSAGDSPESSVLCRENALFQLNSQILFSTPIVHFDQGTNTFIYNIEFQLRHALFPSSLVCFDFITGCLHPRGRSGQCNMFILEHAHVY